MPTPLLSPATRRLVGSLLMLSGLLMGLGLLLRVAVSIYSWNLGGPQPALAATLAVNLLGLLASGLLMRWGLRLRRAPGPSRQPNADEIL